MNLSLVKITLFAAAVATTTGCFILPKKHNLPPAQMLMEPGPGVGGPGPGVLGDMAGADVGYGYGGGGCGPGIGGAGMGMGYGMLAMSKTSQLYFLGPEGMTVNWDTGTGSFDSEPLVAPGRQNFPQGAIYRLKLTKIPGRQGVELYPTVEVAPENPRTEAFLSHNPIPIQFTEEDLDQVATSNFVTKVIYVPDPEFQDAAIAGVAQIVSTRLNPGEDPIVEADRRGSILAIVRLGNIDLEVPSVESPEFADRGIEQVGYNAPAKGMPVARYGEHGGIHYDHGGPMMMAGGGGPTPEAMSPVSGVNTQPWGMPMSGTPIGLPGPPHVPLGVQAGLQKHTIKNITHMHLPQPVKHLHNTVKQSPGFSYPKPASHSYMHERSWAPGMLFRIPFWSKLQQAPYGEGGGPTGPAGYCPPGAAH